MKTTSLPAVTESPEVMGSPSAVAEMPSANFTVKYVTALKVTEISFAFPSSLYLNSLALSVMSL